MAKRDTPGRIPQLRFDKVARRLVQSVRAALEPALPDGLGVVFAVTAPIREPSKTTAAIVALIQTRLSASAAPCDHAATLHGNAVHLRIVQSRQPDAARIIGFVHNPDPAPTILFARIASSLMAAEPADRAEIDGSTPNAAAIRRICRRILQR